MEQNETNPQTITTPDVVVSATPVVMAPPVTADAQKLPFTEIAAPTDKPGFFSKDVLLELVFVLGFSSIFLINSLNAFYSPQDFLKLLLANPITRAIGHYDFMIKLTMVNDLFLGVMLLSKWKKKYVWAWAGVWLLMVAGIKTLYLISLK